MADGSQNEVPAPTFTADRVGVVGLGLIGGSIARALAAGGREVFAANRSRDVLELAEVEVIRGELTDEVVPTCELIVLACYPQGCIDWLEAHADLVSPGAIVMDCSGIKRHVCEACFAIAADRPFTFVGGHPMAGTQYSGFKYARANLYHGAPMVIVPPRTDDAALLDRIRQLLAPAGFGRFMVTTAEEHDRRIAYTSQLAHVVSNAYVKSPTAQGHQGFSAGSYRDLTRVAWLNETMWTELFLDNRDNLLYEVNHLIDELAKYRDALAARDADALRDLLREGREAKERAERRGGAR